MSRRGGISVPHVAVPCRQVLILVARGQTISETGLLQGLGGSGSRHRELSRNVSLGSGGEVGDCVSHRFLVNDRRGESAFDGVGQVNGVRLDPDASEGCWDDRDVRLGDKVREDLLNRVGHSQSRRLDQKTRGGEGDRQSLSLGEEESIGLEIGHCQSVVNRGWEGLCVSDGEGHRLDRLVGNGYCIRGRAVLVSIFLVDDDGRLITTPSVAVTPPAFWGALSIRSLLVSITTVHLGVSATSKGRIWHHLVGIRRFCGRRGVLRRRSTIGRRSRFHRRRVHVRTRVT